MSPIGTVAAVLLVVLYPTLEGLFVSKANSRLQCDKDVAVRDVYGYLQRDRMMVPSSRLSSRQHSRQFSL
jgi:hypothetical protein